MINPIQTRLDDIIDREFRLGHHNLEISGSSSPVALGFFLSQTLSKNINDLPHLIILTDQKSCDQFCQIIQFFDPQRRVTCLPSFDVSPMSGLYPATRTISERLKFYSYASDSHGGDLFVATPEALMQKAMPFKTFIQLSRIFQVGDEFLERPHDALIRLGYEAAPQVEDVGQFSIRGGIVDIFSPHMDTPIRVELFGDQIESLRFFNPVDQRSLGEVRHLKITPAREVIYPEDHAELLQRIRFTLRDQKSNPEADEILRSLSLRNHFSGIDFMLPFFYEQLSSSLDFFSSGINVWINDLNATMRTADEAWKSLKDESQTPSQSGICATIESFYTPFEELPFPSDSRQIRFSEIEILENSKLEFKKILYSTQPVQELLTAGSSPQSDIWLETTKLKLERWRDDGYRIFLACRNRMSQERLALLLQRFNFHSAQITTSDDKSTVGKDVDWLSWLHDQDSDQRLVHLVPRFLPESLRLPEDRVLFLRDEDFFGRKMRLHEFTATEEFQNQAKRLSFGDLSPGDLVVHIKHGIGKYEGLKIMAINGAESEFIQLSYKDGDKLFIPVYRVGQLQKYSSMTHTALLDKLGGTSWEKTKIKVKSHLRDIAHELLNLYAKRSELFRPAFELSSSESEKFANTFPYEETPDQLRAISDIWKDLRGNKPMDRLICGDVGFGKTEVAMRAAFFAAQSGKQVAVLAPTTVLTFQHYENFKKRFSGWNFRIEELNRFVENKDAKQILKDTANGNVQILIGTHRLLSKDVAFKDLGLLIVDEEQKFGVAHKEKIKKLKVSVDTLTLSATPIPRTLNMALVGIRDLSLINSAPVDRLPTRTFLSRWEPEVIRKAITAEINRGGQVYFIHNRIQSIYGVADEVRQLVPDARIKIAHGQMDEAELEMTMMAFFNHEIDILVCTAIVESGMDVPRANTMFIDQAQIFGLSQLYQLRGRVGRSKTRAYCYLLLPRNRNLDKQQEQRLKVIQENTALGSGFKIAQYDLELRGAGNILGEQQSGHVDSVGYELYMDLLNQALAEARGEEPTEDLELDPEINLRVAALIPDSYIGDLRTRLSYYKALSEIKSADELERIEDELRDQFGEIPEATLNLMGLMLIRRQCKELGVRDLSAGLKNISLIFTAQTRLKNETIIKLAMRENKKYSLTPDSRLNVRMNQISWTAVFEELNYLLKLMREQSN